MALALFVEAILGEQEVLTLLGKSLVSFAALPRILCTEVKISLPRDRCYQFSFGRRCRSSSLGTVGIPVSSNQRGDFRLQWQEVLPMGVVQIASGVESSCNGCEGALLAQQFPRQV